jgi:hypothetical protein
MKKLFALAVLQVACLSLLWMPTAKTSQNDEAEIRQLLDRWAKAVRTKDLPQLCQYRSRAKDSSRMTSFRRCNILDSTHIKKTIRNFSTSSRVALILNIEP